MPTSVNFLTYGLLFVNNYQKIDWTRCSYKIKLLNKIANRIEMSVESPTRNEQRHFHVIDTTLRDGLQSPLWDDTGVYYPRPKDKRLITEALIQYGVPFMEVFSPIVNNRERNDLGMVIATRDKMAQSREGEPTAILAHVRCHPKDVEAALKYGVDGLNFYMGTSEESRASNHGKKLEDIVRIARPIIEEVRRNNPNLLLRFSGEDAFRTPIEDLFAVYDPIADLVDRFGTPDTVGIATPDQVKERVYLLRERYPNVDLEGHFHNDRGYALINAVTAIQAGMKYINTSILGLAERSGITSMTALMFNLFLEDPSLVNGYDYSLSYPLNVLMADILKMQVPTSEPISLTNRTHSAGVHTRDTSIYEAHHLERLGVNQQRLLLNPLSGKHLIKYYLTHILNYVDVTDTVAEEITITFKGRVEEIHQGNAPQELLEEIASTSGLSKLQKPVSHVEII